MYEIELHPKAEKELKNVDKQLRNEILQTHLPKISSDPFSIGIPLSGSLRDFKKYVFSYHGTSYRIIFEVVKQHHKVFILMVGPREGLYARLMRRLGL